MGDNEHDESVDSEEHHEIMANADTGKKDEMLADILDGLGDKYRSLFFK